MLKILINKKRQISHNNTVINLDVKKRRFLSLAFIFFALIFSCLCTEAKKVNALPFYGLKYPNYTLRAEFYTEYSKSSPERKHNVMLAAKSLNNAFIDVNAELSFNDRVGARTEKRGYKNAKIIVNGNFVDGIGGGVCQVSTTLYNAALLAGLNVTEKHAHSLQVSYVEPSFDAMVSGIADLKILNCTKEPVFIKTFADGERLTIKIYGEKPDAIVVRKSLIIKHIPTPIQKIIDEKHEFSDLNFGEEKIISYGKQGLISEGYIIKIKNGNKIQTKIRKDVYAPISKVVVVGAYNQQ